MKVIDGKIHIYNISTDKYREITPADVESLECQAAALGFLLKRLRLVSVRLGELRNSALMIGQGKATVNDFPEG